MTTSCDSDRSFATNLHRQMSRALRSLAAQRVRRAFLTAGTCTGFNCQRTMRGHGKEWRGTERGEKKGRAVSCGRRHTRKYTFPIPFCMIPHRGRTSTRLVGTGAAKRSFEEKTQPSPLTRLEATDGIRGRGRKPRGRKRTGTGLFMCRKLTEELWSAGRSRLSWFGRRPACRTLRGACRWIMGIVRLS